MVCRIKIKLVLLILISVLITSEGYSLEIAKDKLKISAEGEEYIPCVSNYPLDNENEKIRHVILAIHSSNHDAYMVYNNTFTLIIKYDDLYDSVLVISPQFLMAEHIANIKTPNLIYWEVSPFRGSSQAKVTPEGANFTISAYTILESIIASLCEKKMFPNLHSIVILGHSAGGQLVNRFVASNTVEDTHAKPTGVTIKYVVMNPSSCVYFSPKRAVKGSREIFAIPDAETLKDNSGYDNYGYGLANLYAYHRHKGLTAEKIRQQYCKRNVIYMLGEKDVVADSSMSTNPSAMLQGENRLQRGLIYYAHLIDEFGYQIKEYQKLVIVPNVGHSGKNMMLSPLGVQNIIGDFFTSPEALKNMHPFSDFVPEPQQSEGNEN